MAQDDAAAGVTVRVCGVDGELVAGGGLLVTAELIVTCAHVVVLAAGTETDTHPPALVRVRLPRALDPADTLREAEIVGWQPVRPDGGGDSAVLRLREPAPAVASPARLTLAESTWSDRVRIFGYPADQPEQLGVWLEAELRARQDAGWLQLETPPHTRAIGRGFSGSPVWSPQARGVIGIVVAAERGTGSTTAYLLPARALVEAHPELAAPDPGQANPYRGLEPFLEEHAAQFRGRDAVTSRLLGSARQRSLLVLAGPSGSGKSSLVRAGLIPRLRARGALVATFRPVAGLAPGHLLAGAVLSLLEPELPELRRFDQIQALTGRLTAAPAETCAALGARLAEHAGAAQVLLFADQFEELAAGDARTLFRLLHSLVQATPARPGAPPPVLAVLTLRSTSLDELVTDESADDLGAGLVLVPPMTRDQLRDAITGSDVDFEPGLVDRVLDDAGTQPGRLPLVEFTLARLWTERSANRLTHEVYDRLGGVSGALVGYAEDVFRDRLTGPEQRAARRLLVQLARPAEGGTFARRAVVLSEVDEELRPALTALTAARLTVADRTADGTEYADLAHQALLDQWPRLRDWLAVDRDFRSWQEELRLHRAGWEADERDEGGLLRGAPLATAQRWLQEHPDDIAESERQYIRASTHRERRRARVLRTVVAVISVLAVAAGTLAAVAADQAGKANDRLRTAASRALADDANRFRSIDPAMSLQLAEAAWHHAQTPEAYGALFAQYAGLQGTDKVFENLWQGSISSITTSDDGSVAVLVDGSGLPAVWTGLTGEAPQQWHLPTGGQAFTGGSFAVSPSGRYLLYAGPNGGAVLWDIPHRAGPFRLAPDDPGAVEPLIVKALTFSADESRLMVFRTTYAGDRPTIAVWATATHAAMPVANPIPAVSYAETPYFGPDPGTLAVLNGTGPQLYDLAGGRLLASYPADPGQGSQFRIAGHGRVFLHCTDDNRLHVLDMATGAEQRVIPVSNCAGGYYVDSTSEYAVFPTEVKPGDTTAPLALAGLRSGRTYQVTTPPVDISAYATRSEKVAVVSPAAGPPAVLLPDNDLLYRLPVPAPLVLHSTDEFGDVGTDHLSTPDGRYTAGVDSGGHIELTDARTGAEAGSADAGALPLAPGFQGVWLGFTADSGRLLLVQDDTLVSYTVPDLTVDRRIPLPAPPGLGPPPTADGYPAWATSLVFVAGEDVIVLHAGILTRWDLATGRQLTAATPLRTDPQGERRSAILAFAANVRRAGHPDQIAVREPDGSVQIWSLEQRRPVATLKADAASTQGSILLDTTGTKLAALSSSGQTTLWDIDSGRQLGSPVPMDPTASLIGFTPDGELLTYARGGAGASVGIWATDSGKQLATLNVSDTLPDWDTTGGVLTGTGQDASIRIVLDPSAWSARLCAAASRPYTAAERPVLDRDNASDEPPCG